MSFDSGVSNNNAHNKHLDSHARLQYIGSMLDELRKLAKESEESLLVYLIEMAVLEAKDASARAKFRPSGY